MLCMVAAERFLARTMPIRSPLTSVTPALAMAMSVPPPMAMPTSAAASAGASLMPSPAMATILPARRNASTAALFPSGKTSASTSAMPSCLAIASAVPRLSPVSMTMAMPWAFNASSAARVVGFALQGRRGDAAFGEKFGVAQGDAAALDHAGYAFAGGRLEILDREQIDLALGGRRDNGRGERVFARPFDAGGIP